jgi:hypothetical protein
MQPPNYLPEDGGETVWDAMEAISWDLPGYDKHKTSAVRGRRKTRESKAAIFSRSR